jgi:hypothetical protein
MEANASQNYACHQRHIPPKRLWATNGLLTLSSQHMEMFMNAVRTSTPMRVYISSTASYGENFTSLYVDDVGASQETCLWASTACYVARFTLLYVDDIRASQVAPPLPVTGMALLFYM